MKTRKLLPLCAAIAAIHANNAFAVTLSGTVKDTSGSPIEGAQVKAEGLNIQVFTNEKGEFIIENFDNDHVHLHVYSPEHVHGDRELGDLRENMTVDFTLRPTRVENVLVTANPIASSVLESTVPVSVLTGEELRKQQGATLGETLSGLPGVHTSYFGPVASSPIIRGTDGPRVKIVQNGLDVSDASRVGPDHNIAAESSTATQVEVLRGPSTLQFGSGAIGGVVNVVDNRIPSSLPDGIEGEAEVRLGTVADEEFAKIDLTAGLGDVVGIHFDGFTRETEDYEIPGFAELEPDEGEEEGTLENSAMDTDGFTFGTSLVFDKGYIGIAYESLENLYGVPGHAHEHEHGDEEPDGEEEEEEVVLLDVEMDRIQIAAELLSPIDGISAIRFRSADTDYEHTEFEGEETGTVFKNETQENRLAIHHESLGGWHGVIGLHHSTTDFAAVGEEAFTPPNETDMLALYIVEEKRSGDMTWQLGGRIESTESEVLETVSVELHHEDEGGEEPHEEEPFAIPDQDFNSLSLSAGGIWDYSDGYSLAFSVTHSERAPSHQEMFSAGEHISTRTFELGLAFSLDADGEVEFYDNIVEDVTNSLDIIWRKHEGQLGLTLSLFYNQVSDYIYLADTGLVAEEEHDHDDGDGDAEEPGEEEEGLPVLKFLQDDATLYGFEAELSYDFNDYFTANVFSDFIQAELDNEDLPRIPPLRIGSELSLDISDFSADLEVTWVDDQTDVAPFETETDGYTLVDLHLSYQLNTGDVEWTAFLIGNNLTDEEARPHTSFIKDLVPMPGRGFTFGIRSRF